MPAGDLDRLDRADRRVERDESLPLPRHGLDPEQEAERHGVGAAVGDHHDPSIGLGRGRHSGGWSDSRSRALLVEERREAVRDPDVEVAEALAARDAVPLLLERSVAALAERPLDDLLRGAFPVARTRSRRARASVVGSMPSGRRRSAPPSAGPAPGATRAAASTAMIGQRLGRPARPAGGRVRSAADCRRPCRRWTRRAHRDERRSAPSAASLRSGCDTAGADSAHPAGPSSIPGLPTPLVPMAAQIRCLDRHDDEDGPCPSGCPGCSRGTSRSWWPGTAARRCTSTTVPSVSTCRPISVSASPSPEHRPEDEQQAEPAVRRRPLHSRQTNVVEGGTG